MHYQPQQNSIKTIQVIAPLVLALLALFAAMVPNMRDTPTRAEMEEKDRVMEMRVFQRLDTIERKLDTIIMQNYQEERRAERQKQDR